MFQKIPLMLPFHFRLLHTDCRLDNFDSLLQTLTSVALVDVWEVESDVKKADFRLQRLEVVVEVVQKHGVVSASTI